MTIPCTISTRTQDDDSVDEYGNPTEDETTVSTLCWHHQGTGRAGTRYSDEETGLAVMESDEETFYWPPGTAVRSTSAVTVDGVTFEMDGPPWEAKHPRTGQVEYVMGTARRAG